MRTFAIAAAKTVGIWLLFAIAILLLSALYAVPFGPTLLITLCVLMFRDLLDSNCKRTGVAMDIACSAIILSLIAAVVAPLVLVYAAFCRMKGRKLTGWTVDLNYGVKRVTVLPYNVQTS